MSQPLIPAFDQIGSIANAQAAQRVFQDRSLDLFRKQIQASSSPNDVNAVDPPVDSIQQAQQDTADDAQTQQTIGDVAAKSQRIKTQNDLNNTTMEVETANEDELINESIGLPTEFDVNRTGNNLGPVVASRAELSQFNPMTFRLLFSTSDLENVNLVRDTSPVGVVTPGGTVTQAQADNINRLNQARQGSIIGFQRKAVQRSESFRLALWINPKELERSLSHVISDSFARKGHINEFWASELMKISASGSTPAFYTLATGLTRINRMSSGAFNNLMTLVEFYRNNGYVFDRVDKRRIKAVGEVEIDYDGFQYFGRFDNFQITESAESPFKLDYSFSFTVRRATLVPRVFAPAGSSLDQGFSFSPSLDAALFVPESIGVTLNAGIQ